MTHFNDLDQYVEETMKSWHCPGVALAIIKGDEIIHKKAYGLRDIENNLPLTVDTRFITASLTKAFTAMSAALLVDEGKLEWDKPVREYIPEFILKDPYITANITIRDMLSHRTGLPRHDLAARQLNISRAEFIKKMRYLDFSATFRQKFQYCNLMYYASAYLVEQISGIKWEELVKDRILLPLDMKSSGFCLETAIESSSYSKGYQVKYDKNGHPKNAVRTQLERCTEIAPGAGGGLFSTLEDLIQWLKIHLNSGQEFISSDVLQEMHSPQTIISASEFDKKLFNQKIFSYGMGWIVKPYRNYTLVEHGGNSMGCSLMAGFIPQQKIGVIIFTNINGLPLRDVLLYKCIDDTLGLPDNAWNQKFHDLYDPRLSNQALSQDIRPDKTKPSTHNLDQYIGLFSSPGYPDFAVKVEKGEMQACTVGSMDWSILKHISNNTFEWYLNLYNIHIKVSFLTTENGEVDHVTIPLEPTVSDIKFTRKLLEITHEIEKLIEGKYQASATSVQYKVTAQENKIYISEDDYGEKELKLYRITDSAFIFKSGRIKYEFSKKESAASYLLIDSPYSSLKANKI